MNKILELKKVNKCYSNGAKKLHVLKNVEFYVEAGDFLTVEGPSGAGKSTLLHVLGGLDYPDDGEVLLNNKNIYRFKDKKLANIRNEFFGFVFQFYHLLPEFTALENVLLPGYIYKKVRKKKLLERAKKLLYDMGLKDRLDHYPNQLSGGEQQRVAIARAVILKPKILLCDEPTGNLDSENADKICSLLVNLHNSDKQTIIIVTHQESISSLSKKRLFIKDGVLSAY